MTGREPRAAQCGVCTPRPALPGTHSGGTLNSREFRPMSRPPHGQETGTLGGRSMGLPLMSPEKTMYCVKSHEDVKVTLSARAQ